MSSQELKLNSNTKKEANGEKENEEKTFERLSLLEVKDDIGMSSTTSHLKGGVNNGDNGDNGQSNWSLQYLEAHIKNINVSVMMGQKRCQVIDDTIAKLIEEKKKIDNGMLESLAILGELKLRLEREEALEFAKKEYLKSRWASKLFATSEIWLTFQVYEGIKQIHILPSQDQKSLMIEFICPSSLFKECVNRLVDHPFRDLGAIPNLFVNLSHREIMKILTFCEECHPQFDIYIDFAEYFSEYEPVLDSLQSHVDKYGAKLERTNDAQLFYPELLKSVDEIAIKGEDCDFSFQIDAKAETCKWRLHGIEAKIGQDDLSKLLKLGQAIAEPLELKDFLKSSHAFRNNVNQDYMIAIQGNVSLGEELTKLVNQLAIKYGNIYRLYNRTRAFVDNCGYYHKLFKLSREFAKRHDMQYQCYDYSQGGHPTIYY